MNFLAPWFLLGALAVAAPVLFHLIRRSARERMPFSSLLFLRPTPPRATRRRKLEHIALLVLRCLAVLLLAAGFARPFLSHSMGLPPAAEEGRQTIILIDTSASMRRDGLWRQARARAADFLKQAAPVDRVAVLTFDQHPKTLVSFTEWSSWPPDQRVALAGQRLDSVSPGWGGTHLGLALTTAAEQFVDDAARAGSREVALISDLQEGSKLDGLQGHDWPKDVKIILERVDSKPAGNAGLEIVDGGGDGRTARVRMVNTRDSTREKFLLGWCAERGAGFIGQPMPIYLPLGQTRTFAGPELPNGSVTGKLRLTGDDEDFDNTVYFAPAEAERVTIVYYGSESGNDPAQLRYYLQRAFPATARRQIEVVSPASNALSRAALAVIPASLDAEQAHAVRAWVAGGKTALLVMTNAQAGATFDALAGAPGIETTEASGDYALLGEIDFTHPIFAPFADPRFSDFSRIHFWKHRRWTAPPNLPIRVLAKFDDGAPALAQLSVGQGNLLILASGWQPADSQLALSSKFLPLLQTILDWSGGAAPARAQFQIGDSIPAGAAPAWRKPDGKVVAVTTGKPFTETDLPGIYTATLGGKVRRFAVNLPLDESRTTPLSPDDFARLGVPLQVVPDAPAAKSPGAQRRLLGAELESRQKLWRWLLVALLAVALAEVALGGWLAQRVKALEATP